MKEKEKEWQGNRIKEDRSVCGGLTVNQYGNFKKL